MELKKEWIDAMNGVLAEKDAGFSVRTERVFKAGGTRDVICFRSEQFNATPVWYPEADILEAPLEDVAKQLTVFFHLYAKNIEMDCLGNKAYILDNIRPRLCSRKQMKGLEEKGIAYIPWLDLAVFFMLPVEGFTDGKEKASAQVTEAQLKGAGISLQEAFEAAKANAAKACEIKNIGAVIAEMAGLPAELAVQDAPLWVITNREWVNGAAAIVSIEVLDRLHGMLGDFYILPSSVHEVICVPCDQFCDPGVPRRMVGEINGTEIIRPEDYLSDTVYRYTDGKVNIAC